MRALSFSGVKCSWLGAPGLKIHRDLVASRRAVRWQQLQPTRTRIANGYGGSITIPNPSRMGELFLEVVAGTRTSLLLKQIEQATALISNLPAPFSVRDTTTTELIVFMNCSLRGPAAQAKGSELNTETWVFDYDRTIGLLKDLDGAEV